MRVGMQGLAVERLGQTPSQTLGTWEMNKNVEC